MVIYKITNTINGKIYIGKQSNRNKKYMGSGKWIKRAIKKYGKRYFIKEIIESCNSNEDLNSREKYWIKELNSTNSKIGYNISKGGKGATFFMTEEQKKKVSDNHADFKGKKIQCTGNSILMIRRN